MRLVPRDHGGRIDFYHSRLGRWAEHAEQIGMPQDLLAELTTLTEEAREAYVAHQLARQAARTATQRLISAVNAMASKGSAAILQIRAKAEQTGNAVYGLALIPPPGEGAPMDAPGQPEAFEIELTDTGALNLKWKCKNPRGATGTVYHLFRSIGEGRFEFLGMTGRKRFADATIPRGTTQITYQIQARRTTRIGPVAMFHVRLGGVAEHVRAQAMQGQLAPPPPQMAA